MGFDILAAEIDELNDEGFDLDLLGFSQEELNEMIGTPNFGPGSEDEQGKLDEKQKHVCPNCSHEF